MYTFFIIVLVFMCVSFLCSFFCFTFIFVCTKFGLCKEFVDAMFVDSNGKIDSTVKTLIIAPGLSVAPTCVVIVGMLYYMWRFIMSPLMKLYGFMDNTISKEASKQEFKKKLEEKVRKNAK